MPFYEGKFLSRAAGAAARAGGPDQTRKISVSVTKVDLERLKRRAKRLYGGNLSAVIHEMAEQAEKQEAIDKLWVSLGRPTVTEKERRAILAEWGS